jgi:hypothetical protein
MALWSKGVLARFPSIPVSGHLTSFFRQFSHVPVPVVVHAFETRSGYRIQRLLGVGFSAELFLATAGADSVAIKRYLSVAAGKQQCEDELVFLHAMKVCIASCYSLTIMMCAG